MNLTAKDVHVSPLPYDRRVKSPFESLASSWRRLDELSEQLSTQLAELHLSNRGGLIDLTSLIELKGEESLAIDALLVWLVVGRLDGVRVGIERWAWMRMVRGAGVKVATSTEPPPVVVKVASPPIPKFSGKSAPPFVAPPPPFPFGGTRPPPSDSPMVKCSPPTRPPPSAAPPAFVGKSAPPKVLCVGKISAQSPPPAVLCVGKFSGKSAPPFVTPPPLGGQISSKSIPLIPGKAMSPTFVSPTLDPNLETRKLHWQSIPVSRVLNSIFSTLDLVPCSADFELANMHFVKRPGTPKSKPTGDPPEMSTPVIPSLLEPKRVQQVEIFLNGNKHVRTAQVVRLVQGGAEPKSVELLEALLGLYPTKEEVELLTNRPPSLQTGLPLADQFLFDLSQIPMFKYAVSLSLILLSAEEAVGELIAFLIDFTKIVSSVLESKNLRIFFKAVGSFVVYLGRKPLLNGFALDQLAQLRKLHSFVDKHYSALHCVADGVGSEVVEGLICELGGLSSSSKLSDLDFADTLLRCSEIEKSISELKAHKLKSVDFYAKLAPRLDALSARIAPQAAQMLLLRDTAVTLASRLREYFAENDRRPVGEILASLKHLRADLRAVRKR